MYGEKFKAGEVIEVMQTGRKWTVTKVELPRIYVNQDLWFTEEEIRHARS